MKKNCIALLVFTFFVLSADAVELILSFGFDISNSRVNLIIHGLDYILMCLYAIFFLRRADEEYSKSRK